MKNAPFNKLPFSDQNAHGLLKEYSLPFKWKLCVSTRALNWGRGWRCPKGSTAGTVWHRNSVTQGQCGSGTVWQRDTFCRAWMLCAGAGQVAVPQGSVLSWHTHTHNCLFSWKEDVPAAEQCLCDHSCSLVRVQPNGQILWNDHAQQIFYWRECRYGNMGNIEGWSWEQLEEI